MVATDPCGVARAATLVPIRYAMIDAGCARASQATPKAAAGRLLATAASTLPRASGSSIRRPGRLGARPVLSVSVVSGATGDVPSCPDCEEQSNGERRRQLRPDSQANVGREAEARGRHQHEVGEVAERQQQ